MVSFIRCLAVVFGLLSLLAGVAATASIEDVRPLGAYVRRAEDVTPERFARFVMAAGWYWGVLTALSAGLWWRTEQVAEFLRSLWRGDATTPAGPQVISQPAAQAGPSRVEWFAVLVIAAVGCGLRLAELNAPMAYDEAYTWINFASRSLPEAIGDYNSTNNHPLNTLLVYVCGRLFGPQEWALRLPVFVLGCSLSLLVWRWAREWRGREPACLAAAIVAVSPALISYSVDARGYMFVAVAAVVLDTAMARLRLRSNPRDWLAAFLAITLGLCAMPIMVYPTFASCGWYLLTRCGAPRDSNLAAPAPAPAPGLTGKLLQLLLLGGLSVVAVSVFYTPAFLFRGFQFLRDPIMLADKTTNYLAAFGQSWIGAAGWWCDGWFSPWVWGAFAALGLLVWPRTWFDQSRLWLPFAVVAAINLWRHVAPPPRLFLHLAPWAYLLCATGVAILFARGAEKVWRHGDAGRRAMLVAIAVVLTIGAWEHRRRETPFFPEDRLGYQSIPELVERLHSEVAARPDERHLLFAPLPCDLPSLFYMDRHGFRIPHNRRPERGERIWLIARRGESIDQVLGDGLIQAGDLTNDFTRWRRLAEYQTLSLYTARFDPDARQSP
ncbi:MAG: glycosyltransferase family 39 protein [Planctomycetaceae bacterium]